MLNVLLDGISTELPIQLDFVASQHHDYDQPESPSTFSAIEQLIACASLHSRGHTQRALSYFLVNLVFHLAELANFLLFFGTRSSSNRASLKVGRRCYSFHLFFFLVPELFLFSETKHIILSSTYSFHGVSFSFQPEERSIDRFSLCFNGKRNQSIVVSC